MDVLTTLRVSVAVEKTVITEDGRVTVLVCTNVIVGKFFGTIISVIVTVEAAGALLTCVYTVAGSEGRIHGRTIESVVKRITTWTRPCEYLSTIYAVS